MDNKIKFRCAIYMGDYGINIFSNYSHIFDILRKGSFVAFIPEYRCVRTRAHSDYSIIYIKDEISSARMVNNKSLEIRAPLNEVLEASTIPFRAHFMLEPLRQENSVFTTQGAGVSRDRQAVLLMGKRGSGKTSVSLELCRKYNCNLIGNDLVLVGLRKKESYLYGGTKVFSLRLTTVKYYNTDLQKYFSGRKSRDEWTNKINLYPEDLGISIENKPIPIAKAYYLHLDNRKSAPLYIKRIGDKETAYMGRLFLYEDLSRYIRGVCIPVVTGAQFYVRGYIPSLDTIRYHKNRVKLIDSLIDDLGFYYISGSMDAICRYIDKDISRSQG